MVLCCIIITRVYCKCINTSIYLINRRDNNSYNSIKNISRERRFIIYKGIVEASKVPQEWNAWLHHVEQTPPKNDVSKPSWSKNHSPNLTGTPFSYEYKLDKSITKKKNKTSIWKPNE